LVFGDTCGEAETQMKKLPIPKILKGKREAIELARVWVGLGDLHVMLNIGMYGGKDGPGETTAWGDIMAGMIRHVAHAISMQTGEKELQLQRALLKRLRESLKNDERTMSGDFEN
jgi:hypothetical protein